jgi:hypothetical protein
MKWRYALNFKNSTTTYPTDQQHIQAPGRFEGCLGPRIRLSIVGFQAQTSIEVGALENEGV